MIYTSVQNEKIKEININVILFTKKLLYSIIFVLIIVNDEKI